ncbi:MAG: hypothetical protein JWO47_238 [Candidatus Saccharibacteria bacterium]|nr:hypothetical protein [Candidatus Saccharibacteria bacterium]
MRLTVGQKTFGLLAGITALLLIARPFAITHAIVSTLPNRYVKISDSTAGTSGVEYELGFDATIPGTLGSIEAEFCENDPFPGTPCTVPAGFDISAATLVSQSGTNDFTIDALGTNAHRMVLSRVPSAVGAVTFKFLFNGVTNPSATGTQYVRLTTYSGANRGGSVTDKAGIAFSINGDLSISTEVPPHLDMCVGVTIPSIDCTSVVGDTINMGTLKTSTPAVASSQFVVGTNADNGYTVTVSGAPLTSGNNVLQALTSLTTSTPGVNQFGMNLRQNVAPVVGNEPAGVGSALPVGNYNIPDNFIFKSGDVIVSASAPDNYRRFTASYIANIDNKQPIGFYATTISFIALGSF